MSSPSSFAPFLHVLFVPSSCWDRLHVASCPAPLPAQSHHSDPPGSARGHHSCIFIFTFLQNHPPRLSASPFVSREAPRPCVTSWCAARGARLSGGDGSPQRVEKTLWLQCWSLGDPWDITGMLGWREGEVVSPALGTVSGAGLLLGASLLAAMSLHPGSSSAGRSCSLCPAELLLF